MEGVDKREAMEIFRNNIKKILPDPEKNGVVGLIEPINPWSIPQYNMDSYQDALSIIKSIHHPNLKLQLDIFHLQQIDGNLTRNITELLPYVGHIQVAQVPSRGEPDADGEVNYGYIFRLLDKLGYEGYVGLEYAPVSTTTDGLAWIKKMGLEHKL